MEPKIMTIRDLNHIITSELRITFDEDPCGGTIDIIVPIVCDLDEVLGDRVLNMPIHLMEAQGDTIVVSTGTR